MTATTRQPITLDQFLKHRNVAESGGEAKQLIQGGLVRVNDEPERRRGRKLEVGDRVMVEGLADVLVVSAQEGGG